MVDVFAGAVWTLANDISEEVTQQGYSFTRPYFYGPTNVTTHLLDFDENLAMATRQDDPVWSSLVSWATQSVVYAEAANITQNTSHRMELIDSSLFGPDFSELFRNAVGAVGNYAEIYNRHLSSMLPRGGRNRLNRNQPDAPLIYIPPGFDISP